MGGLTVPVTPGGSAAAAPKAAPVPGGLNVAGAWVLRLDDPELNALVGELSLRSEDFRQLWADHEVKECASGTRSRAC